MMQVMYGVAGSDKHNCVTGDGQLRGWNDVALYPWFTWVLCNALVLWLDVI